MKTLQVSIVSALCAAAWLNVPVALAAGQPELMDNPMPVMAQNNPGFAPGELHPLSEACIADPASCNLTAEQVSWMQACMDDPSSTACTENRPFPNNEPTCVSGAEDCPQPTTNAPQGDTQGRPLPPPESRTLSEECVTDPASCNLTAEQVAGIQACEADIESAACIAFRQIFETGRPTPPPLSQECIADPASCDLTTEQVAGIQACEADPESEACIAHRQSFEPGRPAPQPLSQECIADPASCDLTTEQVAGIQACEADPESETCIAHRQTLSNDQNQPRPPRPPMDGACLQDPVSCGLTEEQVAGLQACNEDHASDACQAFHASNAEHCQNQGEDQACNLQVGGPVVNCDNDPTLCGNPGPALFDINSMRLQIPAVRLRINGQLSEQFYSVDMELHADGQNLTLRELRALNTPARIQ